MELLEIYRQLSPVVQLAVIISGTILLLVIACSRYAAENLALFFRELRSCDCLSAKKHEGGKQNESGPCDDH